jgi:mannose-6-phosphate isomerase class I
MYDKRPFIPVSSSSDVCRVGWDDVAAQLYEAASRFPRAVVCVECYPGAYVHEISRHLSRVLRPVLLLQAEDSFRTPQEIQAIVAPWLTDDPVFGKINDLSLEAFFDPGKIADTRGEVTGVSQGIVLVIGTGATIVVENYDLLIYADMARWEIQQRQRSGSIGNLGADNLREEPLLKYKRSFFMDWRLCDRLKRKLLSNIDYLLDTNIPNLPKMIPGAVLQEAFQVAVRKPFRVVPFFDPGPWGGHWMKRMFDLPKAVPNYAWCFDCVPEENSLLLGFDDVRVEIPAADLVFSHPEELLGEHIVREFGAEFPIRFDFLDTVGGGNLSLQVHPLTEYMRANFGLSYTQDESYYILDAVDHAHVYLGLKEGVNPKAMLRDLETAQTGKAEFNAPQYVNQFPARKHDHFLIPAGTVHCSGAGNMVLEVSATPYIFTFKLWDWGRPGLNGRPRPIHLHHGAANIEWNRTTQWVEKSLINRVKVIGTGEGWTEERTGLHELQFIETRRHWFCKTVPHNTNGTVNVLNLVGGQQAVVESSSGAFEPFTVHYAETFIVPAKVGSYTIRPSGPSEGKQCVTLKAFVREQPRCRA